MAPPDEVRQLPGVKGQWIKVSEWPEPEFANYEHTRSGDEQYWRPHHQHDPRLFALGPALTKRKIVQLVCHAKGTAIYAVADDGTAWVSSQEIPDWIEIANLPDREAPNA